MKNNTQIKVITQYNKLHSSTIGYKIAMILLFLEKFYKMQQDKFFFFNGNHLEMYNSKKIYNHFHIYSTSYL